MPISIDIGELGGAAANAAPDPLDEVMSKAFESPNGLEIEYGEKKAAEGARFRFYRRRRALESKGINSFKNLIFTIEGHKLIIKQVDLGKITEL